MFDRRGFLSSLMTMAGAAPAFPSITSREDPLAGIPAKLPDRSLYDTNEEAYWAELRRQFLIPEDEEDTKNGKKDGEKDGKEAEAAVTALARLIECKFDED